MRLDMRPKTGRIAAVDAGATQAAAKKFLQPDGMLVVAVGDRGKIEPEIRKLNLGTIEIRDAEAKVVSGSADSPRQ